MRRVRVVSSLSFFDSVMLGIGFIVGSGIFIMPLIAAETSGTYSIVAWVVGGIYQILTGLCFAECAMKIPKVGGLYSYAHKAYGDFTGFFAGWTFWIGYLVTIAAEQWALGWYLQFFLPQYSLLIRVTIGVLTGLVLTYLNFRGVKLGGRIEDYFTVGKLLIIALFIIGALIFFKLANFYPLIPPGTNLFPAIGSTSIIVLYAYLGEEIITVPEGESEKAKKLIPKAIMIASVSTMIIYLLVVVAFLGAARWTSFTASQSPLAAVFSSITHSEIGGIIITVGGVLAIIGSLNAVILGTARIATAMSNDGLFPKIFGRISVKRQTPYMSLLIQTVIAVILTYTVKDFVTLASIAVFFTIFPYAITAFATLGLIKKAGGRLDILHSKAIPLITGLVSIILLGTYLAQPLVLEVIVVLFFVGLLIFIERKKIHKL